MPPARAAPFTPTRNPHNSWATNPGAPSPLLQPQAHLGFAPQHCSTQSPTSHFTPTPEPYILDPTVQAHQGGVAHEKVEVQGVGF